jgi:hypothetical protein
MADEAQDDGVHAVGPDGKHYLFPKGTTPDAVIAHFRTASPQSSSRSPIAPPALRPPDVGMHKSYLIGDPNKDPANATQGDIAGLQDIVVNAGKSLARVSGPNVVYQAARKAAPSLGLPEGLGMPSPEEVILTGVGAAEGAPEAGESRAATATAEAPKPKTGMPEPPLEPEQQAKYTSQLDKANKDFAEDTAKYTKKVADAATERKRGFAGEPGGPQFEAEKAANRKDVLNRSSLEHTRLAQENLQQTYAAARGALDQRWGQFRTQMEGTQLDPVRAFEDIEAAEKKYLKGSPASLKLFNDLATEIGIKKITEEGEVITPKSEPPVEPELPFDTARVHYSAIGDKLSSGTLPGNVYHALKAVQTALDDQLTEAADSRGLGKEYDSLKSGEHQFRSDWTDSKSPLAKAFKAQDPNFLQGHLTGKGSDLLMQQLSRYRKFGAKPYLTAAARRLDAEASAIKVPKAGEPKPLGVKKPTLAEVKRPVPKVEAPETPKAGKFSRTAGRIAGKVVGGSVGSALGHPLLGYSIGGEVGTEAANAIARRRGMPPPPE